MPHIDTKYKYVPLPKYPHMRPGDSVIWNRYMNKNPDKFLHVWYDYKLGDSAPLDDDIADVTRGSWYDLTRWAADVVAEDEKNIYVIEVKPKASASALGQAISYATLFAREVTTPKRIVPVILTDIEITTTRWIADMQGVQLWVA